MSKKYYLGLYMLLLMFFFFGIAFEGIVYAAEPTGEYLQYQESKPGAYSSGLSTLAYVFSLLVTFAIVIGLAYFASRFLGEKMGSKLAMGNQKIIATLPMGANRAIYVVEIAGKFLIVGVTDHSINVLQEITDPVEIEKMQAEKVLSPEIPFDKVFQRQLASLQRLSPKFPNVFNTHQSNEEKHEGEKR
ncbi:flagellar biosynthetic protein FliO [Pelosinus sp. sgz500959]|uniref:flagellar biosynthetic protein FliO n=1 Tax=Pelosinus sp. sgz500959 TaxID=3242472 RepID=UPI0036704689